MSDEQNERVETIQQIPHSELKAGGFLFQLPEESTEDDRKAFDEAVKTAIDKGFNLTINPAVKVIDAKRQETVKPEVENKVVVEEKKDEEEGKKEENTKEEKEEEKPSEKKEEAKEQPQKTQPQKNWYYYGPVPPPFQTGTQPQQYNPFVGTTMQVTSQPQYNPQPITPVQQEQQVQQSPQINPMVNMPGYGFYYQQEQPKQEKKDAE